MATTEIQHGDVITVPLAADAASGALITVGKLVGVLQSDGKAGENCEIKLVGCHRLPKVSADDITQGAVVYAKIDGTITTTASGNVKCGHAIKAAGNGAETADVRLSPVA